MLRDLEVAFVSSKVRISIVQFYAQECLNL